MACLLCASGDQALAPLIKPLPSFDEVVLGKPAVLKKAG
jgi:hypothetical protein